jgi:hypothetical protein
MKYYFLFVSVVVASIILGLLISPKEGTMKLYLLVANVLVLSVIVGMLMAR